MITIIVGVAIDYLAFHIGGAIPTTRSVAAAMPASGFPAASA